MPHEARREIGGGKTPPPISRAEREPRNRDTLCRPKGITGRYPLSRDRIEARERGPGMEEETRRAYTATPIQVEVSLVRLVDMCMRKHGCTEEEAARRWFGDSEYYDKWREEKEGLP